MAHSSGNPTWQDSPSTATLISAATLENIEGAVDGSVKHGDLVFNVQDYGAKGDGTTDDTTALTSAYSAARAAKGVVQFQYGKTYIVSGALDPSGTTTRGYGATLKTKPSTTMNYNILQGGWTPFSVYGLTFDLNKANTTDPAAISQGAAVYVTNSTGWTGITTVEDCNIINGYQSGLTVSVYQNVTDPLSLTYKSSARISRVRIDSCSYGVVLGYTTDVTVEGCSVSNIGNDGINDYQSVNTKIIGGQFSYTGGDGIVTAQSYGFEVNGADVHHTTNIGIVVGGGLAGSVPARNYRIANCNVRSSTLSGISLDTTVSGSLQTPQVAYGNIVGNVVETSGQHGLYCHNAKYVNIIGNQLVNNTLTGIGMDSYGCTVAGNTLTGNATGLGFYGTATSTYGSHAVGRNVIQGNTTDLSYDTHGADNTTLDLQGTGVPAVAAPVGSTYHRVDGGTSTSLYVKESGGVTTSGWVAK